MLLSLQLKLSVGLSNRQTINDLQHYTDYEVRIQACLEDVENGCATSTAIVVRTGPDVPKGMGAPYLTPINFDAIHISWNPPLYPNGNITKYRVYQRTESDESIHILINEVDGDTYEFIHSGQDVHAYTVYEFKVTIICLKILRSYL